jgi:hypothetical protein
VSNKFRALQISKKNRLGKVDAFNNSIDIRIEKERVVAEVAGSNLSSRASHVTKMPGRRSLNVEVIQGFP